MGVSILSIVPNVPMNSQRFLQGFFIAEVGHEFKLFPDIFSNFAKIILANPRFSGRELNPRISLIRYVVFNIGRKQSVVKAWMSAFWHNKR